ncbi:YdcF family protein [Azotosporobacter soli]|uniref:YdcF family protein n=1 Tax=Azotosporobacter soli TaxID=3055040 RepID=UPI0031FF34B1
MLYWIKFIYTTFFFPPGLFIVLFFALALRALKTRRSKLGLALLALTLLFYGCSIPLVSNLLVRSLESRYAPPISPQGDIIIVLGGGATLDTPNVSGQGHLSGYAANRLLTALQLERKLQVPIVVSGGKVLATTGCEALVAQQILLDLGVAPEHILLDEKSLNTAENARNTARIMQEKGYRQPILVTSAFHMARSVEQFTKNGVIVQPYPSDYLVNVHGGFEWYHLWPSAGALAEFSLAAKEYLGLLAVKWY